MTSGERMVWAAEFVRSLSTDVHSSVAARDAAKAVTKLRDPGTTWLDRAGDDPAAVIDARAMLDDMLSNGGDR